MHSVYFINANIGWAVGGAGIIIKTTDGGATWTQLASGTNNLRSVYFVNSNIGWAVGDAGIITKTTDGGGTWTQQTSGTKNHLRSVYFVDNNTGWAVGDKSVILKTTDGGTTWTRQISRAIYPLYPVYFVDSNTGWAVGFYGTILKTTNGGETPPTFVEGEMDQLIDFTLFQNYPNPFNSSTVIEFYLPDGEDVNLIVYDVLGREVGRVLDGVRMGAGRHRVSFNADGLPSGVYFYELRASRFRSVKKMILIK